MSSDDENECPLCLNPFEAIDLNFHPCPCGYRVCVWCFHEIKDQQNSLCPACRAPYSDDVLKQKVLLTNNTRNKSSKRDKSKSNQKNSSSKPSSHAKKPEPIPLPQTGRELVTLARQCYEEHGRLDSHIKEALSDIRILQRNLLYIVGLSSTNAKEEVLSKQEYFGRFGEIIKIAINRKPATSTQSTSFNAYITFKEDHSAKEAIQELNGGILDRRQTRATYGTTKFCSYFLSRLNPCANPNCLYLHNLADPNDCFTKEELAENDRFSASFIGYPPELRPLQPRRGPGVSSSLTGPTRDENGDSSDVEVVQILDQASAVHDSKSRPVVASTSTQILSAPPVQRAWGDTQTTTTFLLTNPPTLPLSSPLGTPSTATVTAPGSGIAALGPPPGLSLTHDPNNNLGAGPGPVTVFAQPPPPTKGSSQAPNQAASGAPSYLMALGSVAPSAASTTTSSASSGTNSAQTTLQSGPSGGSLATISGAASTTVYAAPSSSQTHIQSGNTSFSSVITSVHQPSSLSSTTSSRAADVQEPVTVVASSTKTITLRQQQQQQQQQQQNIWKSQNVTLTALGSSKPSRPSAAAPQLVPLGSVNTNSNTSTSSKPLQTIGLSTLTTTSAVQRSQIQPIRLGANNQAATTATATSTSSTQHQQQQQSGKGTSSLTTLSAATTTTGTANTNKLSTTQNASKANEQKENDKLKSTAVKSSFSSSSPDDGLHQQTSTTEAIASKETSLPGSSQQHQQQVTSPLSDYDRFSAALLSVNHIPPRDKGETATGTDATGNHATGDLAHYDPRLAVNPSQQSGFPIHHMNTPVSYQQQQGFYHGSDGLHALFPSTHSQQDLPQYMFPPYSMYPQQQFHHVQQQQQQQHQHQLPLQQQQQQQQPSGDSNPTSQTGPSSSQTNSSSNTNQSQQQLQQQQQQYAAMMGMNYYPMSSQYYPHPAYCYPSHSNPAMHNGLNPYFSSTHQQQLFTPSNDYSSFNSQYTHPGGTQSTSGEESKQPSSPSSASSPTAAAHDSLQNSQKQPQQPLSQLSVAPPPGLAPVGHGNTGALMPDAFLSLMSSTTTTASAGGESTSGNPSAAPSSANNAFYGYYFHPQQTTAVGGNDPHQQQQQLMSLGHNQMNQMGGFHPSAYHPQLFMSMSGQQQQQQQPTSMLSLQQQSSFNLDQQQQQQQQQPTSLGSTNTELSFHYGHTLPGMFPQAQQQQQQPLGHQQNDFQSSYLSQAMSSGSSNDQHQSKQGVTNNKAGQL